MEEAEKIIQLIDLLSMFLEGHDDIDIKRVHELAWQLVEASREDECGRDE